MTTRRPFTPKGSSEKQAVLSNRHHNIPLYASIGEIIDNSIEWGAADIRIFLDWKETNPDQPKKIVLIDNGVGMDSNTLSNSLVAGFHEDEIHDGPKIGKFGVGCTYAFLSNCRKAEVYSKQKDGEWNYAVFDIDSPDLENPAKDLPPDSILRNPPEEYKDIWSKLKSGTVTVWSKFDRGHVEIDEDEIPFWISRAYRKFIGEKIVNCKQNKKDEWESVIEDNKNVIKIYYNKELLKAYDPLYAIPYREKDKEGGTLLHPLVFSYTNSNGNKGNIIVQFGLSPEEWRLYSDVSDKSSAKDPINSNERYIRGASSKYSSLTDSRKISILRNAREVSWLHDGWLYGRIEDIDRWWGIEIIYDDVLDEVFNVKNVKYQVGLTPEIRKKLREEILSTVHEMRARISDLFILNRNEIKKEKIEKQKKEKEETGNPIGDLIDENDLENVGDTKDETIKEFLEKQIENDGERKKLYETLAERKFAIHTNYEKRIPKDTNLLFEFHSEGGQVLMEKYMNHPWFIELENIRKDMEGLINSGEGVSIEDIENQYHEIEIMWNIFLQTLVISLATLVPNDIQQKYLDKLLSRWGLLMSEYIEKNKNLSQ